MQLHTILLGVNTSIMQFCVFTGSGSPSDEWHHETDAKGNKVIRVEFEVPRMFGLEEFNEAIKNAERVATEEYHKHCALLGPTEVKANLHALGDYLDFVRSTEGAFTNKEGITVALNNGEVKVALGQYVPTPAENAAADDFFARHGVRPYVENSAEIDKAINNLVASFPMAFGIVKQPMDDPAYSLSITDTGYMAASTSAMETALREVNNESFPIYTVVSRLPTSDPAALDAMIEKRTKVAEALRKQGLRFVGYGPDEQGNKVPKFEAIEGFEYIKGSDPLLP